MKISLLDHVFKNIHTYSDVATCVCSLLCIKEVFHFVPSFNITLTFQTVSTTSLLLYLQGTGFMNAKFTALEIVNGILVYSYDLGGGPSSVNSSSAVRYDDGAIHRVRQGL